MYKALCEESEDFRGYQLDLGYAHDITQFTVYDNPFSIDLHSRTKGIVLSPQGSLMRLLQQTHHFRLAKFEVGWAADMLGFVNACPSV